MKAIEILFLVIVTLGLIGCNDAGRSNAVNGSEALIDQMPNGKDMNSGKVNNAPMIVAKTQMQEGGIWNDKDFNLLMTGKNIKFDFSQSSDDRQKSAELIYEIKYMKGISQIIKTTSSFTENFDKPQMPLMMQVSVTDAEGLKTSKVINYYVKCSPEQIYSLSSNNNPLDPASGLYITPNMNLLNSFRYDVSELVVDPLSGDDPGKLSYIFDFNGDGVYDTNWITLTNEQIDEYVLYRGLRTVKVQVRDDLCKEVKELQVSYNFGQDGCGPDDIFTGMELGIPFEDGRINPPFLLDINGYDCIQADQLYTGYYFMQGRVLTFNGGADPIKEEEVIATQKIAPGAAPKNVQCSFNYGSSNKFSSNAAEIKQGNASLKIVASKKYTKYGKNEENDHGFELMIRGLKINVSYGPETGTSTSPSRTYSVVDNSVVVTGAYVDYLLYNTDGQADVVGAARHLFSQNDNSACTLNLFVENDSAAGQCPSGGVAPHYEFRGSYSCPGLKDSQSQLTAKVEQGEFYCEVMIAPPCPVGGGGGGGTSPIPE